MEATGNKVIEGKFKKIKRKYVGRDSLFYGSFSWEGAGTLPKNSYKPSRKLVKEKDIGSAVEKILHYTQTDTHPFTFI